MGELSPWHWIIVLLIFALLFGSRKLPDAARGLGRSLRIFKSEMSVHDDEAAARGAAVVSSMTGSVAESTTPASTTPAAAPEPESVPVEDAVPPVAQPEPAKQD